MMFSFSIYANHRILIFCKKTPFHRSLLYSDVDWIKVELAGELLHHVDVGAADVGLELSAKAIQTCVTCFFLHPGCSAFCVHHLTWPLFGIIVTWRQGMGGNGLQTGLAVGRSLFRNPTHSGAVYRLTIAIVCSLLSSSSTS